MSLQQLCTYSFKNSHGETSSILKNTSVFLDDMAQACRRAKEANRADATPTP